jgi:zinc/manganese transport system permease protein
VSFHDIFDQMFLLPFLNGLVLAALLPVVGAWVRLREEWLAALGLAQISAAGVVLGAIVTEPGALVALVAAAVAAAVKAFLGRAGNDTYAVMILLGWSAALLGASVTAHGDELGRALMQGQLYFTGREHLVGMLALAVVAAGLLPWLSPRLLLGRFFPDHFRANGVPNPHHDVIFDVLAAVTLALAATAIGVMAAFALVFIPPWVAFRVASGWRKALVWSAGLGVAAYLIAFVAAIRLDQPFGPVLVAALLVLALGRLLVRG